MVRRAVLLLHVCWTCARVANCCQKIEFIFWLVCVAESNLQYNVGSTCFYTFAAYLFGLIYFKEKENSHLFSPSVCCWYSRMRSSLSSLTGVSCCQSSCYFLFLKMPLPFFTFNDFVCFWTPYCGAGLFLFYFTGLKGARKKNNGVGLVPLLIKYVTVQPSPYCFFFKEGAELLLYSPRYI